MCPIDSLQEAWRFGINLILYTIMPSFFKFLLLSLFSISLISFGAAKEEKSDKAPTDQKAALTEVILLPTIHRNHLKDKFYNLQRLESVMRDIKPDLVCSEITPPSLQLSLIHI